MLPSPVQQLLHHVVVVVAEVVGNLDPPRPETTCIFAVVSIGTQRFPEIDMCMLRLLFVGFQRQQFVSQVQAQCPNQLVLSTDMFNQVGEVVDRNHGAPTDQAMMRGSELRSATMQDVFLDTRKT